MLLRINKLSSDPKNRRSVLNALWSVIQHGAVKGRHWRPRICGLVLSAGTKLFGGIVIFVRFRDSLASRKRRQAPTAGLLDERDLDENYNIDSETADMLSLVRRLAEPILNGERRRCEFSFQQLVNVARADKLFEWMLNGNQAEPSLLGLGDYVLTPASKSSFGKLLARYFPQLGKQQEPGLGLFRVGKDSVAWLIRTSCRGRYGRRKFIVELARKNAE